MLTRIPNQLLVWAVIIGCLTATFLVVRGRFADTTLAQAAPNTIVLPGIVRDFRASHPDFDVVPTGGYGHYAGNVGLFLDPQGRPVHVPGGYRVGVEWYNKYGQPIPPHLYRGVAPIAVSTDPAIMSGVTIDSYDPDLGAYGGANVGPTPDITVGAPMPTLTVPTHLGPSIGDVMFKTGPQVLNTSFVCDKLTTQMNTTVVVQGHITIVCQDSFNFSQSAHLELAAGATLQLYIGGGFNLSQNSSININTLDPRRVLIYNYGTFDMDVSQYSELCATVISPDASLKLGQGVHLYGSFIGESAEFRQDSAFHSAGQIPPEFCGDPLDDQSGFRDIASTGAITSQTTFRQWYGDTLGTNLSQIHYLELTKNGAGLYEADHWEFFPIDDRLFGNEGGVHNYFFTYAFAASFTYAVCSGQFFEFEGSDDAWLFIDGELALDIGGVAPGTAQHVELERLDLVDGQVYTVQFFYAQRNPVNAAFRLTTNVELTPPTIVGAGSASFD